MKQVLKLSLLLFLTFLIGCSTFKDDITLDELLNQQYFFNLYSIYNYKENKETLELNGIHISLKNDTIQLKKSENMENQIKINLDEYEKLQIEYASFSCDKKYLALELGTPLYLHEIYIVDLDNLKYKKVLINQIDGIPYPTYTPRWSPNKNMLTFGFGDVAVLKPALFYLDDNKVKILTDKNFISILEIKWHKDGEYVDYAVEEESDVFAIYRYDLKKDKFYKLINLTRDKLLLWTK